jgi:hypothetical protein
LDDCSVISIAQDDILEALDAAHQALVAIEVCLMVRHRLDVALKDPVEL